MSDNKKKMTTSEEDSDADSLTSDETKRILQEKWENGIEEEPLIRVQRPAMRQEMFHQQYGFEVGNDQATYKNGFSSLGRSVRRWLRFLRSVTCRMILYSLLPILNWLPTYKWKADFADDCAAGFTVAVMQVPQGLAYAILANVPPIVGIYTAFFPVIVYIILGTSRHVSMGTFAVVSILMSKPIVERCQSEVIDGGHLEDTECAIRVSTSICFVSGIIMLCLGFLRLGALNAFLTDPLVSGFTTGAGVHVFTSQVKYILGVNVPKHTGPGRLAKTYIDLLSSYNTVNPVALGISTFTIVILLGFDILIKPRMSKMCRFPVPMQFIVVIFATVISYILDLKTMANIKVIGHVPMGLPMPQVPDFGIMFGVLGDAFTITIIGFVVSLSIARIMATKHNYTVDPNQELVAMGASNVFGCFFQSLPMTASMSRTLVQEGAGGKTMMASIMSVFLLLWVLLFAGPLFKDLPNAVLASLIMVSLRGIFMQFKDICTYGKRSYSEVFVWLASFLGTIFIDIDFGLMLGLGTTLAFLLWWGYHPKVELIGRTDHEDIFVNETMDSHNMTFDRGNVGIIRISGNLNLANSPLLEGQVVDLLSKEFGENEDDEPSTVVLDLSSVPHLDPSACQQLSAMHLAFRKKGQDLLYVGIRGEVWRRMVDMKVFHHIAKEQCFPTLQDALAYHDKLNRTNHGSTPNVSIC